MPIPNGGFETGSLAPWAALNGTPTVSASYALDSTYGCRLKSNNTAGDTIWQFSGVNFNKPILRLKYKILANTTPGNQGGIEITHLSVPIGLIPWGQPGGGLTLEEHTKLMGITSDPWDTTLPGIYPTGTAGEVLGKKVLRKSTFIGLND